MSMSLETLAHLFSFHGDDMSSDGRRQVAEAMESGESFIIVLPVFAPPKDFSVPLARLSEADWTALLGFEPQNNPALEGIPTVSEEGKRDPMLIVHAETAKAPKVN